MSWFTLRARSSTPSSDESTATLAASQPTGEKPMKTRAAVAWKAGAPLTIETVDLEGPKAGEVLVEIKATGICHTDQFTLSGADPEGLFPAILGPRGRGRGGRRGPRRDARCAATTT